MSHDDPTRSRLDQPPPTGGAGPPIIDLVLADLRERASVGLARYGTPLRAHNGRDALVDAYQEALDLAMYLRQEIEERGADARALAALAAERDALIAERDAAMQDLEDYLLNDGAGS